MEVNGTLLSNKNVLIGASFYRPIVSLKTADSGSF